MTLTHFSVADRACMNLLHVWEGHIVPTSMFRPYSRSFAHDKSKMGSATVIGPTDWDIHDISNIYRAEARGPSLQSILGTPTKAPNSPPWCDMHSRMAALTPGAGVPASINVLHLVFAEILADFWSCTSLWGATQHRIPGYTNLSAYEILFVAVAFVAYFLSDKTFGKGPNWIGSLNNIMRLFSRLSIGITSLPTM